jgi:hypothetical protein
MPFRRLHFFNSDDAILDLGFLPDCHDEYLSFLSITAHYSKTPNNRMSEAGLLRKDELELSLHKEKKLIEDGILKEDNPLDVTDNFRKLCEGCRRGDLKVCQEMITEGANINARDPFDYTPLILVSLTDSLHSSDEHGDGFLHCEAAK